MGFLKNRDVQLRPVEYSDIDVILRAENDSEQWLMNGMSAPFSRRVIEDYVSSYRADPFGEGQLRLVSEITDSNTKEKLVVGIVDLYDIDAVSGTAWVGIYVLPEFRGEGIAFISLQLLERYAGELLNLRILGAKVAEGNDVSLKLFTSSGYKIAGKLPAWLRSGAKVYDVSLFTKSLNPKP